MTHPPMEASDAANPIGEFAAWVRARRAALGLTRAGLAAQAGCSVVALRKLEEGTRRPSAELATQLALALRLPPATYAAFVAWARGHAGAAALLEALRRAELAETTMLGPLSHAPLPAAATSFVGRAAELAAIQARVGGPAGAGLLTLTGPGGVGKTRLALEAAAALQPAFPHGVCFVPLAALRDPALVLPAIARAMGVPETAGQPLLLSLHATLADRPLLLVLDNCEHLRAAAPQVGALLDRCPRLRVLATSREPLALPGEQTLPVLPLAVPAPHPLPALALLEQAAAVTLFVARAQAGQPSFRLTAANAATVAAICARLDGLPLALELAAARVRLLSPAALLARLAPPPGSLELLAGGADRPARYQTLRATIAWSYDLLEATEQTLFRRLAVFRGAAPLTAIEAVARPPAAPPAGTPAALPPRVVLDGIESLIDKSLLRLTADAGPAAETEEPRFSMLEPIREFAWEQLVACAEAPAAQLAHARTFLDRAEAAAAHLDLATEAAWMDRLAADYDNLRAALDWTQEHDPALGLRLAAAVWPFWRNRGHLHEGQRYLAAAPAAVSPSATTSLTARERAVLRLLAQGMTNEQIAAELCVSRNTVQTHVRAIYRKLAVTSRSAATRAALEHGLG